MECCESEEEVDAEVDTGLSTSGQHIDQLDSITPLSPESPPVEEQCMSTAPREKVPSPVPIPILQPKLMELPKDAVIHCSRPSSASSMSSQKVLPPIPNESKQSGSGEENGKGESQEQEEKEQGSEKKEKRERRKKETMIQRSHTVEQVLNEVETRMKNLFGKENDAFLTSSVSNDFSYLKEASKYGERGPNRLAVCEVFSKEKAPELFRRIWQTNFAANFLSRENPSIFNNMKDIMIILWNGTDMSVDLCKHIIDIKLYEDALEYLRNEKLDPMKGKNTYRTYLIRGLMGLINNLVQKFDCVHILRDNGAVQLFSDLYKAPDEMVRCKSLMVLAYLLTEEENQKLNADDKNFQFMIKVLNSCLKSDGLHSNKYGFSAFEMVEVLNRLSATDHNKEGLVRNNILPLYVRLMQPDMDTREQTLACRGIWNLAFKCQEDIQKEPGCVEALEALAEGGSSDDVKRQAAGALWILSGWQSSSTNDASGDSDHTATSAPPAAGAVGKRSKKSKKKKVETDDGREDSEQHVFISYNWGSKQTVLHIKDKLKENGVKVWMDVENMSGSILEAMALAVEKAAVVLICYSQKYKESPNCRTEAEYTFKLGKPIIPLRMQNRYVADGWLGALLGNKLYFDFSLDQRFDASLSGLLRELAEWAMAGSSAFVVPKKASDVDKPKVTMSVAPQPAVATKETTVGLWTEQDVQDWLKKTGFQEFAAKLEGFDGHALLELRYMFAHAPEFFYQSLKTDFRMNMLQCLRFGKQLKEMDLK